MEIKPIILSREKARKEWRRYVDVCKHQKADYLKDLRGLYYQLSRSSKTEAKLIDIFQAFKIIGLNEKFEPKLAICKAGEKYCYFEKVNDSRDGVMKGNGCFRHYQSTWNEKKEQWSFKVYVPSGTFDKFPVKQGSTWEVADPKIIRTQVPIVPAKVISKIKQRNIKLENCYVFWEVVDGWQSIPKDPFLLKRLSKNLFMVLGQWDLTELEQSIIRGRT